MNKMMLVLAGLALVAPLAAAEVFTVDATAVNGEIYYVDSDDATVWEENGVCAGLQKVDVDCDDDPETLEPADSQVA